MLYYCIRELLIRNQEETSTKLCECICIQNFFSKLLIRKNKTKNFKNMTACETSLKRVMKTLPFLFAKMK